MPCRTLFDAKPHFSDFLRRVVCGDEAPVTLPPLPTKKEVPFFAAPEDEDFGVEAPAAVPSKRAGAAGDGAGGKKRKKKG
jgi:hypothetical protein